MNDGDTRQRVSNGAGHVGAPLSELPASERPITLPSALGRLKCRWCDFSCPRFYKAARGARDVRRSGYELLRKHVSAEHPAEEAVVTAAEAQWEQDEAEALSRQAWHSR